MSKTRNEAIAEKMGYRLVIDDDIYPTEWWEDNKGEIVSTDAEIDFNDIFMAKLLQARMVENGWVIEISVFPGRFFATAKSLYGEFDSEAETEQSALVELFCKVYEIA